MFDEHASTDALKTLPPLTPVAHAETGVARVSKPRRRWVMWVVPALVVVLAAGGGGFAWHLNHQTNQRAEQATADIASVHTASAAYAQAQTAHNTAIADAAAFAPRLERTVAKVNEYPALFDETARERFESIVEEYFPAASAAPHTVPAPASLADEGATVAAAYRAGGAEYELARAEITEDATQLDEQADELTARAEGIRTTRDDVDAALAALAASAVKLAPDAAVQYPKASDEAKQAAAAALAEVAQVADGSFAATPERMPTVALYEYVNAVLAADASHASVVEQERLAAEAEAARLAAEAAAAAEAEARRAAQAESRGSSGGSGSGGWGASAPPQYTGGGSQQEWMAAAGIAESDWGYVDYIVRKESGWNPNAINSSSGACGLVQIMPLHTAAYANCTDPVANLSWANGYANGRYGGWAGAYDFWVNNSWW